MPLAILLGRSPVAMPVPTSSGPLPTFYILSEAGDDLTAEDGIILRTE